MREVGFMIKASVGPCGMGVSAISCYRVAGCAPERAPRRQNNEGCVSHDGAHFDAPPSSMTPLFLFIHQTAYPKRLDPLTSSRMSDFYLSLESSLQN